MELLLAACNRRPGQGAACEGRSAIYSTVARVCGFTAWTDGRVTGSFPRQYNAGWVSWSGSLPSCLQELVSSSFREYRFLETSVHVQLATLRCWVSYETFGRGTGRAPYVIKSGLWRTDVAGTQTRHACSEVRLASNYPAW